VNRPRVGRIALVVAYVALTWFFGGRNGLIAGVVICAAWWFGLPRPFLWAASVGLLAAAPVALMAQGLPPASGVDPTFATSHLVAHVLVGLAMATAGFAALTEIMEGLAAHEPIAADAGTPLPEPSAGSAEQESSADRPRARPPSGKSRSRSKRRN